MSAVKGLCVEAAARVILPAPCVSHKRSEEPGGAAVNGARGPGAGRAPGAGRRPGAAPSPVTVSSLSLTVCSQLDIFCDKVKASAD